MKPFTALIAAWLLIESSTYADKYYVTTVRDLDFAENQDDLDEALKSGNAAWMSPMMLGRRGVLGPHLRLPEENAAYMTRMPVGDNRTRNSQANLTVAFRIDDDKPVTGYADLLVPAGWRLRPFKFTLDPEKLTPSTKEEYEKVQRNYYLLMGGPGMPGAAWFRHLGREKKDASDQDNNPRRPGRRIEQDLSPTFSFFSGARAVAENLALDRDLILARGTDTGEVPISEIKGITVRAIDWKTRLPDGPVEVDPLAHAVPHDQHALFAGSIGDLLQLIDVVEKEGAPILQGFDVRNPYRDLPSRYLAQLGVDDREALRQLPAKSIAVTGGDPFLPSGSDVAILLETDQPEILFAALVAIVGKKAEAHGAKPTKTEDEPSHRGYENPTRGFSCHVMRADTYVAVTNSAAQVSRLAAVQEKKSESLGATDEFKFFRTRYARNDEESAFVFLSDATIRRWCGPRMRIAGSRRNRAIAALGELTARRVRGKELGSEFEPLLGKVTASDGAQPVISDTHGTLGFLTPVSELSLEKVTTAEKTAYENWRRGYEDGWARVFDPIAVRFSLSENEHRMDLTVLPLTVDSSYQEWIRFAGKAALSPMARNTHDESLLFVSFAVDSTSPTFREFDAQLVGALPGLKVNPLSWVGQSVSVFLEKDFFWKAMKEESMSSDTEFVMGNYGQIPLGLRVESKSGIKLALFLTALKGLAETAAPGMTRWETRKHVDRPYVAIIGDGEQIGDDISLFYAPMPKALLVALDEGILKRAMEREQKHAGKLDDKDLPIAKHAFLETSPQFLAQLAGLLNNTPLNIARRNQSWRALPILNDWHRRVRHTEPAQFHRHVFGDDLYCPGGKGYRWNAEAMTMESVAYGYPGSPRDDGLPVPFFDNFNSMLAGLGFVDDGLRLRAAIAKRETNTVNPAVSGKQLATAKELTLTRIGAKQTWAIDSPHPEDFDVTHIEVLSPGKFGEKPTIRTRTVSKRGDEPDYIITVEETLDKNGLTLVGETSEEEELRYTKHLIELPPTLVQGRTYVYEYDYVSTIENVGERTFGEVTLVPVGLETITTKAGTFEDCVRVETTDRSMSDGFFSKAHVVTWYKKGLGPVKTVTTASDCVYSTELTSYVMPTAAD